MSTSAEDADVAGATDRAAADGVAGADVSVVGATYDQARALGLEELIQAEYVVRYGGPDETPMDAAEFAPPAGQFLIGFRGDVAVACGGWRRLGPDRAEVKRMFVAAEARRTGVATQILAALERGAAASGVTTLVLETGDAQPEAIALYTRAGYQPIARFGHYRDSPRSVSLGKTLPPSDSGSHL